MFQVDHLAEVKELAEDGDWAIRIPTTVVIELEVIIDDHYDDCDDIYEILHDDYYGDFRVLRLVNNRDADQDLKCRVYSELP